MTILLASTATPPSPPPGGYTEPWEVSPGIGGFTVFFVLALALAVIAWFMTRSVRRIDHRTGNRPSAPVPPGGISSASRPPETSDAREATGPGTAEARAADPEGGERQPGAGTTH